VYGYQIKDTRVMIQHDSLTCAEELRVFSLVTWPENKKYKEKNKRKSL